MMMVDGSKHTKIPRCKFYNSGFCKFREQCRERHFSSVCQVPNCNQDCQARHPRLCKLESYCKFFQKGICAYKHVISTNDNKLEDLEKELNCLRKEIQNLYMNSEDVSNQCIHLFWSDCQFRYGGASEAPSPPCRR